MLDVLTLTLEIAVLIEVYLGLEAGREGVRVHLLERVVALLALACEFSLGWHPAILSLVSRAKISLKLLVNSPRYY